MILEKKRCNLHRSFLFIMFLQGFKNLEGMKSEFTSNATLKQNKFSRLL